MQQYLQQHIAMATTHAWMAWSDYTSVCRGSVAGAPRQKKLEPDRPVMLPSKRLAHTQGTRSIGLGRRGFPSQSTVCSEVAIFASSIWLLWTHFRTTTIYSLKNYYRCIIQIDFWPVIRTEVEQIDSLTSPFTQPYKAFMDICIHGWLHKNSCVCKHLSHQWLHECAHTG